jgi:antitoxin PrlF
MARRNEGLEGYKKDGPKFVQRRVAKQEVGRSRLVEYGVWYYNCKYVMVEKMESAITVKGQATIPKPIREHLGLGPGDRVKFFVHPDGSVVLLPKLPASAARGIVKSRKSKPVTTEQMTAAVAEGALRRKPSRRNR